MSVQDTEVLPSHQENVDFSEDHAIPNEKSGVRVDPNAALQTARFYKGEVVHMAVIIGGARSKGVFTVRASQYNSSGGYWSYQLLDPMTETLYKNGAWVREKDLKRGG